MAAYLLFTATGDEVKRWRIETQEKTRNNSESLRHKNQERKYEHFNDISKLLSKFYNHVIIHRNTTHTRSLENDTQ